MPVEEDQTRTIKVCRHCGNHLGQRHRWWCRYYPDPDVDAYTYQRDDEDYIIIS